MVRTVVIAFFDVDETVVDTKSMFDFLRFTLAEDGDDGDAYQERAGRLHRAAARGVPRAEVNRAYYRLYAGARWSDLMAAGRRWYADLCGRDRPFIAEGLCAHDRHRAAGYATVLVSGSFRPCLEPLAAHLGASEILCTEPVLDPDGRLTGEVHRPMIGDNKRAAVLELIDRWGAGPADCYGYGDHSSDLPFLAEVGYPAVIGSNPELLATAAARGWRTYPATPCPAPPLPAGGVLGLADSGRR